MIWIGHAGSHEIRYIARTGEFLVLGPLSAAIVEAFEAGACPVEVEEAVGPTAADLPSGEIARLWALCSDSKAGAQAAPPVLETREPIVLPDEGDCTHRLTINCGTVAVTLRADSPARRALFPFFERYYTTRMSRDPLPVAGSVTFRQQEGGLFEVCVFSEGHPSQLAKGTATSCFVETSRALAEIACDYTRRLAVLHAATLVRGDKTVILVNPSGSGKTTLAWLMTRRAGFEMVHDDCLPINHAGDIVQMLTPSTLKQGSWKILQDAGMALNVDVFPRLRTLARYHRISPCEGSLAGENRHFLFVQFHPGSPTRLAEVDAVEAFTRMIGEECVVRDRSIAHLRRLFDWMVQSRSAELRYDDVEAAISMVDAWLGDAER